MEEHLVELGILDDDLLRVGELEDVDRLSERVLVCHVQLLC
jgi:hypothetical protein